MGDRVLRPNRRVILTGLVGRADLNEAEATLLATVNSGGQRSFNPKMKMEDIRRDIEDRRVPVQTTVGGERILVRLRNLTASVGVGMLGRDGLYACFLKLDPASALLGRRVCQAWSSQLTLLLANPEWQAAHMPLPALCRASAWAAAALRLDREPGESQLSCADWLEGAEAEARTGVKASGVRIYPEAVEQAVDDGDMTAVLKWLEDGGHVDARGARHGYTLMMIAAEVGSLPLVEALLDM